MTSELPPSTSLPRWFPPALLALLVGQLVLTWAQGGVLHRQHQEIAGLREEIQTLTEALEQGDSEETQEGGLEPANDRRNRARRALRRASVERAFGEDPETKAPEKKQSEESDSALKDLESSRDSAQRAVKEAREVRQKFSIEENARRAEEQARLQKTQRTWQPWIGAGLGLGVAALLVRSWLRRRSG